MAQPESAKKQTSARPDFATIGGLVLALGGIIAGLLMEGGKIQDIAQLTSALIVLGGTLGAVMITTPLPVLIRASKQFSSVVFGKVPPADDFLEEIIGYAARARKNGIVSLEQEANSIGDPFLRKALGLAVDGIESDKIRDIMELEIEIFEQKSEAEAKVFESAGGYAPTIGIIGAVLGLIQVMKNLADIDEVGRGIAVAFVATIYGVGVANIIFLPVANKLKARTKEAVQLREMMLQGVLSIAEGLNQKLIRMQLEAYSPPQSATDKALNAEAARAATASAPVRS
jgi:chemotaxis protein MotA